MTVHVVLFDDAVADVDEIVAWYQQADPKQVSRFFDELEHTRDAIEQYPESGASGIQGLRHRHLRIFPYSVWYVFSEGDMTIPVLAVLHDRRDERILQNRTLPS